MRISKPLLLKLALSSAVLLPALASTTHAQAPAEDQRRAAILAVQSTLPSVAIIGQKPGPAQTTEVFIQVPGVLNMQSVYVLSDQTTVISGVVIPPVTDGFPGAQLSLPSGEATLNPRAPRENLQDINSVLGVTASSPSPVPAPKPSPTKVVVPEPSSSSSADVAAQTTASSASKPVAPEAARASASASGDEKVAQVEAEPAAELKPVVIETLDQVAESGEFGRIVATVIQNDSDIAAVRNSSSETAQQGAYLDLVRSLPAVVQGSADRKVYVMFDPNCPVCHRYYNEVALEIAAGQIEVHWIPAIVFPDERSSLTASAALLAELDREGGDPVALLRSVMTEDGYNNAIDGAPRVDRLVPYLGGVVKNTAVMAMARAETPLIIFENKNGSLAINPGIPRPGYTSLINRES